MHELKVNIPFTAILSLRLVELRGEHVKQIDLTYREARLIALSGSDNEQLT